MEPFPTMNWAVQELLSLNSDYFISLKTRLLDLAMLYPSCSS